jgi:asparagine synthase (glutamine-hydrolysing)
MLDGDFAIALWNSRNKKLILARDKIGIKPLYYIYWNNTLCFSSEAKSFIDLNFQSWRKELDSSAVATLLGFQYYFDIEHTIIKGVQKVPAGSLLEFDSKGVVKQRYWTLEINPIAPSYSEAVRTTKNLLREAVIKRVMNCDVDQGILLSGGLDSSTVAALAANHLGHKKIKTFTSISDNKQDERQYARQVAKHLGADHTEILMDYKNILGDIDNIIKVYDDLNSFDPGIISTFLLSGLVKKHGISVVLVGEGADEALGGYSWYGLSKFPFNLVPSYIRSTMYYYILSRGIHGSVFNKNRFAFHNKLNSYKGSIYQKITQYEVSSQLPNHFNYKVDKGNMANAVEARLPYLDPTFVEYVFNLPDNYKLNGSYFNHWKSWEKRILRDIGREYLPENIVNRKKHGFMLSMDDTLRSNKKFIIHRITNNKELILNYLSQDYYDWLFMETGNHLLAKEKEFMTWRLFLFSVWYDYYFN